MMFEEIFSLLRDASLRTPLLICLEDLHALDPSTLELLEYLAQRQAVNPASFNMICTLRTGESPRYNHKANIAALINSPVVKEIILDPLNNKESQELLECICGTSDVKTDQMIEKAGGNPLFLYELARDRYHSFETPVSSLNEVLERRLSGWDDSCQQVMDILSLSLKPLSAEEIISLVPDLSHLIYSALESLESAGILKREQIRGEYLYSFTHSLLKENCYRRISYAKRNALHLMIGDWMEKRIIDPHDPRVEEAALHFERGGDKKKAFKYHLSAAQKCESRYAQTQAINHYQGALKALDRRVPDDKSTRLTILFRLARLYASTAKLERSLTIYRLLLNHHDQLDPRPSRSSLLQETANVLIKLNRFDEARQCLSDAIDDAEQKQNRDEKNMSTALMATLMIIKGDYREAETLCIEALRISPPLSPSRTEAFLCASLGQTRLRLGHIRKGMANLRKAQTVYRRIGHLQGLGLVLHDLAIAYQSLQDYQKAEQSYQESLSSLRQAGDLYTLPLVHLNLATCYRGTGRYGDAWKTYDSALHLTALNNHRLAQCRGASSFAKLCVTLGFLEKGKQLLKESHKIALGLSLKSVQASNHLTFGVIHQAQGNLRRAAKHFLKAIDLVTKMQSPLLLARATLHLADLFCDQGKLDQAETTLSRAESLIRRHEFSDLETRVLMIRGKISVQGSKKKRSRGIKILREARSRVEHSPHPELAWEINLELAKALLKEGEREEARSSLEQARARVQELCRHLPEELRIAYENHPWQKRIQEGELAEVFASLESVPNVEVDPIDHCQSQSLVRIAEKLNASDDLQESLEFILDEAIQLTGAKRGFIVLIEKGALEFKASRDFKQETLKDPKFIVSHSLVKYVSEQGRTVITGNAFHDARFKDFERIYDLKLQSIMAVPFNTRDEVLGVIYLDNHLQIHAFSQKAVSIVEAFCHHAALAIHRMRTERELKKTMATDKKDESSPHDFPTPVGTSPAFEQLLDTLQTIAPTAAEVLIKGETGTGKELVAREIHRLSPRRDKPFIKINCAALPRDLLEAELFGYEKGAFTGAIKTRRGKFELAHKGTLFLDEVGDLPLELQAKILHFLQEKRFYRLGGQREIKVDVRIIAATHKKLELAISKGLFREDLFYRLNVIPITIPPLRKRHEDIHFLASYFLHEINQKYGKSFRDVSPKALEVLSQHDFPGNVRELKHEIERIVATDASDSSRIEVHHLSKKFKSMQLSLKEFLKEQEIHYITDALKQNKGNLRATSRTLQVEFSHFYRKLKKLDLIE